MRQGEVDGVDYHFLSEDDFNKRKENGFFVEYASYRGWQYGSAINFKSGEDKIIVLTPAGARALLKVGELRRDLRIIYLDVDRRSRLIKLLQRGDDIEEAYRRSLSDVGQFDAFNREADYVIYNKQYEKSVTQLCIELSTYIENELIQ
jgi:guanylate kinase